MRFVSEKLLKRSFYGKKGVGVKDFAVPKCQGLMNHYCIVPLNSNCRKCSVIPCPILPANYCSIRQLFVSQNLYGAF
jgi:hypothetical protein